MKPKSRELSQDAQQRELDLYRQPEPNSMPMEVIRKQPDSGAAFTLACASCGKTDQEIGGFVGIDPGTFSKMKKGAATLQGDEWKKFRHAVNNTIYFEWCAFQLGCTLVEIKSEAERRADALAEQLAAERLKVKTLTEAFHGRVAA